MMNLILKFDDYRYTKPLMKDWLLHNKKLQQLRKKRLKKRLLLAHYSMNKKR